MKTTKGGKVMNPTDAYRKEIRKKELKRNKKERKKVREVGILKKDPETIKEQIDKLEMMKADGALDKARKHKKRQLEDTLNLVLKKRKEYEEKLREKGEPPVMFSHLGPPRRRTTTEEEESAKHPKPEDSVYYHPTLNPTGAPPPGKPPMYKSSIGPRIPLPSSLGASSSKSESEDGSTAVPPPPPPPPLPESDVITSTKDSHVPLTIPLPPPPPAPTKPPADTSASLPTPHLGPPPQELASVHGPLPPPPPPPVQRPLQPAPPGTRVTEDKRSAASEGPNLKETIGLATVLPPPPPPPGHPPNAANRQAETAGPDSMGSGSTPTNDISKMTSFMFPPSRQPFPVPSGLPLVPPLQPDMVPPGLARFPPLPPDMRPTPLVPGLPNRPPPPPPPGMVAQPMGMPPLGAPPGPPLASRPLMSSLPSFQEEDLAAYKPSAPQKPSYVKSAASTVVKKPLAQHTPELTAMVPASVRVRRETAAQKAKPRLQTSLTAAASRPSTPVTIGKAKTTSASAAPKAQSIDDSYMAFLEDMKTLGALDS